MNGDEDRDVRFRSSGGPGGLAKRTGMPSWRGRWQHRQQETARQKEMWRGFAQQPGTHLLWVWTVNRLVACGELRTAEQQAIADHRGTFRSDFGGRMTVSVGGRSFTVRNKKLLDPSYPPSWPPGVAEVLGHPEGSSPKVTRAVRARIKSLRELVDELGTPVLYTTGMHFNHRAKACITFPDGRRLEFPIQGRFMVHAIMTAVDQDGNKVAQYRVPSLNPFRQTVEIIVHPDWTLTDELVLAIAISAPWLSSYFSRPEETGGE